MSEFQELIKSFGKSRDYVRDFFVYGFKSRQDFTSSKKSARTYDDERRRITSWLGEYVEEDTSESKGSRVKNISLVIDSNLLDENSPLFIEKTERLTAYQMNFLRAIIAGVHQDFGLASIREEYSLGSSSNIVRIKDALVEKEFIDITPNGIFIADPILETWLRERGKL